MELTSETYNPRIQCDTGGGNGSPRTACVVTQGGSIGPPTLLVVTPSLWVGAGGGVHETGVHHLLLPGECVRAWSSPLP